MAPSDPNVVYVGSGDQISGGAINEGNGVYKSTDAGRTWQHIGLDETKQIPRILVDPHDPNLVIVAAEGNLHQQSDQRGIFRSTDGGQTWQKTLFVDNEIGGQDIAWAYDNPSVMLATTVRHYNAPGAPPQFGFGQQQANAPVTTRLFKSTDEGATWTEISGHGLPKLTGRTSVAIAKGTNSSRMFIIGTFGLYRSDDGGASWKQMAAKDRRIANGQGNYTSGVYVNPNNPDIVYTLATSSYWSHDGGESFTGFKGAPGGDDPQQMWIDPTNGDRLLLGVDQGATISLDGGQNWSSWYNQPTAQVYHISVDNQFPYWVYATQQDSGSIATRSRGDFGEITPFDWLPHPGYEFGSIVADPLNPKISYAGGPGRGIVKVTYPSGQWIDVSPNMDPTLGLRQVGNQPLGWSPQDPHELLAGFQYLMATTDGGEHWKKLSPDLTQTKADIEAATKAKAKAGASTGVFKHEPLETDGADEDEQRFGGGAAIESFSCSTVAPGTIWVGTSNGLVKVTKNDGHTWEDASIPNIPNGSRADISTIDASHQDAGAAYVAVDCHNAADFHPYLYRTHDYGKTWTLIVNGLATDQPSGSFARVIRADTKRAGLLFAGTESSMYVSFDDGDHWQSLMLNLPTTSYRDIAIHENDLVVGTYGRAFWVLDDYSPLRELAASMTAEAAHLFKPGDAIRVRRSVNGDTPFPPEVPHAPNPPLGAIIYYSLGQKPTGDIKIEISDSSGNVVRHMSSAAIPPSNDPPPPVPDFWVEKPRPMPTELGLNRINWNLRHDNPPSLTHDVSQVMGAVPGETPWSPEGPLVLPGTYTVKLIVDGKSYTQTVSVKNDPRSPATMADLKAQHDLQMKLYDGAAQAYYGYQEVAAMKAAAAQISKANPGSDISAEALDFSDSLTQIGGTLGFGRMFGGGGGGNGQPPAPTFARVGTSLIGQLERLDYGDLQPTEAMQKGYAAGAKDLKTVEATWTAFKSKEVAAFNASLTKHNLSPIAVAMPESAGRK